MPRGNKLQVAQLNEEGTEWVLCIPAKESYTITEAAQIVGKNRVVVRQAAIAGRFDQVTVDGIQGVTHESILKFLATESQKEEERKARAEAKAAGLAEKKAKKQRQTARQKKVAAKAKEADAVKELEDEAVAEEDLFEDDDLFGDFGDDDDLFGEEE